MLIALAAVMLAGCATNARYQSMIDSWVGKQEMELIRQWGPPHGSYDSGGHTFLTYTNEGSVYIPGTTSTASTTVIGNSAYTNVYPGMAPQNIRTWCRTVFEVADGVIVSSGGQGNHCVATGK
jgi:hypothetical protein